MRKILLISLFVASSVSFADGLQPIEKCDPTKAAAEALKDRYGSPAGRKVFVGEPSANIDSSGTPFSYSVNYVIIDETLGNLIGDIEVRAGNCYAHFSTHSKLTAL